MNAVGIDGAKGKSMVAVLRPLGEVVAKPFEVNHTSSELAELAKFLKSLDGEMKVIMEPTGHYYEPVAHASILPMDTIRYQLKTLNRQFHLASKNRTACSNNLVALLEQYIPGVRGWFDSPVRKDGSQKWVDFARTFWHVGCVRSVNRSTFAIR